MSKEAKEVEVIKLKPSSINTLWELRKFTLLFQINNRYPFEKRKEGLKAASEICGVDLKTVQNWCNIQRGEKKDIPLCAALSLSKWLGIPVEKLINIVEKKNA